MNSFVKFAISELYPELCILRTVSWTLELFNFTICEWIFELRSFRTNTQFIHLLISQFVNFSNWRMNLWTSQFMNGLRTLKFANSFLNFTICEEVCEFRNFQINFSNDFVNFSIREQICEFRNSQTNFSNEFMNFVIYERICKSRNLRNCELCNLRISQFSNKCVNFTVLW